MRVLVACEESQAVTKEFRKLGHEAYSCDLIECSGGFPEWHIKGDVKEVLNNEWDLIIAFPPCTYLSNAGARHLYPNKLLNVERYKKGLKAREFFMMLYNADCKYIAIENPLPSKIYNLPKHSQIIQPWEFGHDYQKRTLLWLKNLPVLMPTEIVLNAASAINSYWFNKGGKERQKYRSKTFSGVAQAMAYQWSYFIEHT